MGRALLFFCLMLFKIILIPIGNAQSTSFIDVQVDNDRPYVGEVIVYNFKFYDDGVTTDKQLIPPTFQQLGRIGEVPVIQSRERINGIEYTVFEQITYLYSSNNGDINIDPARIEIPETPFQVEETILSNPINLDVIPLPVTNAVVHGVGDYQVDLAIDQNDVQIGDLVTVTMTIRGSGYLQGVSAPASRHDTKWRIFAQPTTYNFTTPIDGEKIFQWDFIAQEAGNLIIGWEPFTYFNPRQERYITQDITPASIIVQGNSAQSPAIVFNDPIDFETDVFEFTWQAIPVDYRTSDLRFLQIGLWFLPIILAIVISIVRRTIPVQSRMASNKNKYIQDLDTLASDNPQAIHEGVVTIICHYVGDISGFRVSEHNLEEGLAHLPQARAEYVRESYQQAQQARYAPVDDADAKHLIRRMRRLFGERQ